MNADEELDQCFATWSKQFEAWLLSTCVEVDEAHFGRGTRLELEEKTKVSPIPFNVQWQDRHVNFWHALHRIAADLERLIEGQKHCPALKQKLLWALTSMSKDLDKHWPQGGARGHFLPLGLLCVLNTFGAVTPQVRIAVLEDLQRRFLEVSRAEAECQKLKARHWMQLSLKRGGRLAHQTLKAGEVVLDRPFSNAPVHERPGKRRE